MISTYLVSTFTLAKLNSWFAPLFSVFARMKDNWRRSIERRREEALERLEAKRRPPRHAPSNCSASSTKKPPTPPGSRRPCNHATHAPSRAEPVCRNAALGRCPEPSRRRTRPTPTPASGEIPICQLAETPPAPANVVEFPFNQADQEGPLPKRHTIYRLPSTDLLNEIPIRSAFDEQELKNTAAAIKAKFEEFNVFGSVVQINPGPVVTTFEFKPEAGIKYSRITTLTEDLCLGLQAESILIERIPGKPTIGIEVPNTKREVISLRADYRIRRIPGVAARASPSRWARISTAASKSRRSNPCRTC